MTLPEHITQHDLHILADHLSEPWNEASKRPPKGWPDVFGLDIPEFVAKAYDGAIVDDLDEPDSYLVEPGEAVRWRKQAFTVIVHALQVRYRRPLNGRDLALVSNAIVEEWEKRADDAAEAAAEHEEGKLWRHVDMSTYSKHD